MAPIFNIESLCIFIATIVSAWVWYEKRGPSPLSLFILLSYLAVKNLIRIFDWFQLAPAQKLVLNNVTMLVEIIFYLLIILFLLHSRFKKTMVTLFGVAFVGMAILNAIYWQPMQRVYSNYSFILGSVLVLISILLFFHEQLASEGYRTIFKNFWFWYATALFIFLAAEIPIMSILNYLVHTQADVSAALYILQFKIIVSSFYYLSFSTAYFLCRSKT